MLKKFLRTSLFVWYAILTHNMASGGWYLYVNPDRYLPFGDEETTLRARYDAITEATQVGGEGDECQWRVRARSGNV